MTSDIVALLQFIIFSLYTYHIYRNYGVLGSISESTYKLPRKKQALFLGFLGSVGLLNLVHPMGIFGFLTMVGLWFTGVTLRHQSNKSHTRLVHFTGAVGAIISAFLGLIILHNLWWTSIVMALSIPILYFAFNKDNIVWNVEVVAMILIILSYIII